MKTILLIFFCYCTYFSFAQCITNGPLNPNNSVSDGSGTVAWSSPNNVAVSDNIRSTAGSLVALLSSVSTDNMYETDFGFNIPLTDNICGIQVDVERSAQGLIVGSSIKDQTLQLIKGGSTTGSNYASGASWPSNDTYGTYGGPNDLWGTTWTPAEINAIDFGVAYASVKLNAGLAALFLTARIDHLQITVFSESTLPIELLKFEGKRIDDKLVNLNWTTSSEINNAFFTVERSIDAINWETQGEIEGAGNSSNTNNYAFIDKNHLTTTTYYRLKQTDFNGEYTYDKTITVLPSSNANTISIYPNPSNDIINIQANETILKIEVINLLGKVLVSKTTNTTELKLDLSKHPKEIYFVRTYTKKHVSNNRLVIE